MTNHPLKLPVRSRLPIYAWVFAGVVTLISLVSSLSHVPPQAVVYAALSHAQTVTR